MLRKVSFLLVIVICIVSMGRAQDKPIVLFPEGAPGETVKLVEKKDSDGEKTGGQSVLRVTNVSEPTITIYQAPDEVASGAAIIVCPGGGYSILAYDLEGTEICEWLNEIGITAILLKYRVPRREGKEKHVAPLQDVQRAISYVRGNASTLNIDPARVGVMGFSAGAHLSAMASNCFDKRTYPEVDAADKAAMRPDFCLLVYPAYLDGANFSLAPELKVTPSTPPTMLIQTEDDKSYINSSLFYYYALKEAGVPARLHIYNKGGHGYGLRNTNDAVNEWIDRAEDWFRELGIIEIGSVE